MSTNGVEQQSTWAPHMNGTSKIMEKGKLLKDKDFSSEDMDVKPPQVLKGPLKVADKLLMGPGPSNPSPRIMKAGALPILGHLHDDFYEVLEEVKVGLRYAFQTKNDWTLAISGPGHLAMEAILVNLLEPGEKAVVGCNGLWGMRAAETARRIGADVHEMQKPLGSKFTYEDIETALKTHQPKVLFLVHSESSTGIIQSLEGIGELCHNNNCLLCVDTVASLGGVPFFADKWKVDAVYTGSQKVLGCPPGISPISFSPRAVKKIKSRTTPIKSFLVDMNLLSGYWKCTPDAVRTYHHTPPVSLIYCLREALAMMAEEGLENMWARHQRASLRLRNGLKELGLQLNIAKDEDRLPTVTTFLVPDGLSTALVSQYAMEKYLIEIAGGIGPTAGKLLRIGTMGYNAYPDKVDKVLSALKEGLEFAKTKQSRM